MIAYAYIRVSGDEQADRGLPVAGQRQALERYAAEHNIIIDHYFIDEARPGGTDNRARFQQMVHLLQRDPPPCEALLLWSWARFARDQADAHFWKASLRRAGIHIIDVSGEVPDTTPEMQWIFEALVHWKDEQKLVEISAQARRGQQTLARMGYVPSGGPPPRGFMAITEQNEIEGRRRTLRRWVPDPTTWPLVLRAWDLRLQGSSYNTIWRETHLYKTPYAFNTFFANTIYKGELRFGDTLIPVPAAVTPEQWDQVNRDRAKRIGGSYSRRQGSRFLLSGLLTCGRCGAAMSGDHSGATKRNDGYSRRQWDHYKCTRVKRGACDLPRIGARALETAILDTLFTQILTTENLATQLDAIQVSRAAQRPAQEALLGELQSAITDLERAIIRLVDAIESAPDSTALTQRLAQREHELAQKRQQLHQLHQDLNTAAAPLPDLDAIRNNLRQALTQGAPELARNLLRTLISEIIIDADQATIRYNLPPPF